VEPLQENSFEVTFEMFQHPEKKPEQKPAPGEKIWSQDHQWSLFYANEGPPLPEASHVSHEWNMSGAGFWKHYRDAVPDPDILTAAKLKRLIERYEGTLSKLPALKDGTPVHRLSFPELERRDVLRGLRDYADLGQAHRDRLEALLEEVDVPPGFHVR